MTSTTIRRMNYTQVDESVADARTQLAQQARALLGYDKLARALVIPDALLFALRELGIEPLVRSGVEEYKRQKARPGMWHGHKEAPVWFAIALAIAIFAIPWMNGKTHDWSGDHGSYVLAGGGVIALCILACVFAVVSMNLLWNSEWRGSRITREWRLADLAGYQGNIPEFALARAVQIRTACPKAGFHIDCLYESVEKVTRVTRDPFLVVSLGSETYYIDVWDEKEYEARL